MDAATLVFDIDSTPAKSAARALLDMDRATAKAMGSVDALTKSTSRMGRDAQGRFRSMAAAADENRDSIKQLASEFNPLLSAQLRMADAEKRLAQAVAQGVVQVDDHAAALAMLRQQYAATAVASQRFAQSNDTSAHSVMNLGYQLNDIGMMMSLGQNPFALMMQQGPQVAQIFAQMNAQGQKIGPTLAAAFTSIINPTTLVTLAVIGGTAALTQWIFKSDDAATANTGLRDSYSNLASAARDYSMALQTANQNSFDLIATFGSQAESLQRLYDLNVQLQNIELGQKVREAAVQANAAYGDLGDRIAKINELINYSTLSEEFRAQALADARWEMEALNEEYGLSLGQAKQLNDTLKEMGEAKTIEEQALAAEEFGNQLLAAHRSGATIPPELIRIASEAGVAAVAIREIAAASREAAAAWIDVNRGQFITGYDNPNPAPGMDEGTPIMSYRPPPISRPRGGGGGGGASASAGGGGGKSAAQILQEDMQKRYEVLQQGFASEYELASAQYIKDMETLQFALDQKLVTQQEYELQKSMLRTTAWGSEYEQSMLQYQIDQEALQAALDQKLITEQEYLQRRQQLNWEAVSAVGQATDNGWAMQLNNLGAYMGEMNQIAGGGYDKLLKAQKIFAAASALISTYQGAAKALELPFPYNIAAAAKVIAAGLGFVSAIKSGGSASSGGGRSSAAATTAQQPQEPTRTVTIDLRGGTTRDREFAEQLIQDIYQQSKDGRVIIARDNN